MKCPYCGSEIKTDDKFCGSCGAPLNQAETSAVAPVSESVYAPADQSPVYEQPPAGPAPASLKEFIQSSACPEKIRKSIKSSWIILLVCAGITLAFEILTGIFPIDAVLLVVLAFWLRAKCSYTPAILALALGVLSMVIGLVQNGSPSGILVMLAGSNAFSSIYKAKQLFKSLYPDAQS